jgi:hypothetical protein
MPKRNKKVRSRELRLDLRATLEADTFEDAVGELEADLQIRWKGKNLPGDAKRQAQERGWAKDLLKALMYVRFAIGGGDAEKAARQTLKLAAVMKRFEWAFCYGEDQQTGVRLSKAGHLGAIMKSGGTARRDLQMAREFIAQSAVVKGGKSDTALMADIGKSQQKPLGPSQSHAAVTRGLHALVQDKEAALEQLKAEGERLKDSIRSGAKPDK